MRKSRTFDNVEKARAAIGEPLSLGVCWMRCSMQKDRKPQAIGWKGTAGASSKRCPVCARTLKRMSAHSWCSEVVWLASDRALDARKHAKGRSARVAHRKALLQLNPVSERPEVDI